MTRSLRTRPLPPTHRKRRTGTVIDTIYRELQMQGELGLTFDQARAVVPELSYEVFVSVIYRLRCYDGINIERDSRWRIALDESGAA